MYSSCMFVNDTFVVFAITKAGMKTLSTINLPVPEKTTVVLLSIKMARATSEPI